MTRADHACVVIPMYNEAATIGEVLDGLHGPFDRLVCIDDGSTDNCGAIARAHGAKVLRHEVNLGQGAALQTGFDFALRDPETRYLVTFDADGQHRAEDARAMVDLAVAERLDLVLGSRFIGQATSAIPRTRRWVLRTAVTFTRWSSGLGVTDTHNGLRVLNRHTARQIHVTLNGMAHSSELLNQLGRLDLRWQEHPVVIDYTEYSQAKGQSNINAVNILLDLAGRRLRSHR